MGNASFKQSYDKLNQHQKMAVDYIDGPLMVLAGPGTGKTQLLSLRVANILQKTDASPSSILCLTFTEKAASNMKQRMLDVIGIEARNVNVKTFHSLGAEIIAEYPDSFYNSARLEPAPEAVKLELVDRLLSELPFDNPLALKFAGQNTLVRDVQSGIDQAKKAGLTPEKLLAITEANLVYVDMVEPKLQPLLEERLSLNVVKQFAEIADELPDLPIDIKPFNSLSLVLKQSLKEACQESLETGKTKTMSEWKKDWSEKSGDNRVLKERKRNEWWRALAGVYKDYQEQMHKDRYFDFADMILDVLTELEQNKTLRVELQERYRYIMIDEFQDTNDAQLRLAHLLANHESYEGSPNIMAVGDDDQAIYRFQGAEITNAETFINSYKNTKNVVLRENYRSHQTVISTGEKIATQIENRLVTNLKGIDKHIKSASDVSEGTIKHLEYSTEAHQYTGLAEQVKKYHKSGSVAVLARNHSSLEQLAHVLQNQGVPIDYEKRNNIFELQSVKLLCNLLRACLAVSKGNVETLNVLIPRIVADKSFAVEPVVLWNLAKANSRQANWLDSLLESEDKQLQSISKWLVEVARLSVNEPLMISFEYLLGLRELNGFVSPVKTYFNDRVFSSEYIQTLSAIQSLRSLVVEFSREPEPTLERFVEFLDLNEAHGVVIADESVFVSSDKAAELMTVYKAKGLEFDTVFVVDCTEKIWKPRASKRKPPANLESLQAYGENADDYARLMFVAATRAKSNLIFTSYANTEHGDEVVSTPLIYDVEKQRPSEAELDLVEVIENDLTWPEIAKTDEKEILHDMLENYQLSVTNLINFIDLENGGPKYFVERNLLRIPDVKTPSLAFGTAIHDALYHAQVLVNKSEFDLEQVKTEFDATLQKQQIEKSQQKRYQEKGHKLIDNIFSNNLLELVSGNTPEKKIRDCIVRTAKIKGDIDLLVHGQNEWTVVDYKTGAELNTSLDSTTKTEGMKALKHRMQLTFYALMLRSKEIAKQTDIINGEMIYLEAKSSKNFRKAYRPTREDLENMEKLIDTVWQKIQNLDWPDTSVYSQDFAGTQEFISDLINGKVN